MRSGPALKQKTAHRAIHDGAQVQAKSLTASMIQLFHEKEEEDCLEVAKELLQHWEEKIVAHADAEDEGIFLDLLKGDEVPDKGVYMEMKDHALFREISTQIKKKLTKQKKVTQEIIYEFTTLIILNDCHHKLEEATLFPGQ